MPGYGGEIRLSGSHETVDRTQSGHFTIDQALTLSQIEQLRDEDKLEEQILPVDAVFSDYPAVKIFPQFRKMIDNGNSFALHHCEMLQPVTDGTEVRYTGMMSGFAAFTGEMGKYINR